MIKLRQLSDELILNTYNYATLACERLVRGEFRNEAEIERVSKLYDKLADKTEAYLKYVKEFAEQVSPLLPADEVKYMQDLFGLAFKEEDNEDDY